MTSDADPDSMPSVAAMHPPRSLSGFALAAEFLEDPVLASIFVVFRLACKDCGGGRFRLFSFSEADELLPPHSAECVACGRRAQIFDPRTDGYDGVLNGGCAYRSGNGNPVAGPGELTLKIGVGYNIDPVELAELGTQYDVHPSDLFDAINICAYAADGTDEFDLIYECA